MFNTSESISLRWVIGGIGSDDRSFSATLLKLNFEGSSLKHITADDNVTRGF